MSWLNEKCKFVSVENLGQTIVDWFMKLSKIGFSMECFTANKLWWLAGYPLSWASLSGIFFTIRSLQFFGTSWGSSYIHFLVIITYFCLLPGNGELSKVVWRFFLVYTYVKIDDNSKNDQFLIIKRLQNTTLF